MLKLVPKILSPNRSPLVIQLQLPLRYSSKEYFQGPSRTFAILQVRLFQCAHTLDHPLRVQSSADFSSCVLLCLPSLPAFPLPHHVSNPLILLKHYLTNVMHIYSVVAAMENLVYVTSASKIDFYSQPLGNGPSVTNTNFRKNLKQLTVGWFVFLFFLSESTE